MYVVFRALDGGVVCVGSGIVSACHRGAWSLHMGRGIESRQGIAC
jgi:hypothetical protein